MNFLTQSPSGGVAPLIAIIGCDGSGKSTVSEHILKWISRYGPSATVHLGKQSGNVGRALAQLPLIGGLLGRLITRKSKGVRDRANTGKHPDIFPAMVISAFALRRRLRFKRMLALRHRGFIVVTDRFPQLAIPGAYDGPEFSLDSHGNPFVEWLARREHAMFEWMTSHRPDLVVRLNVDLDTACARKPDHRREALGRKIAVTPLLTYHGAPIVDIDANQPLASVLEEAEVAVARIMAERGYAAEVGFDTAQPRRA